MDLFNLPFFRSYEAELGWLISRVRNVEDSEASAAASAQEALGYKTAAENAADRSSDEADRAETAANSIHFPITSDEIADNAIITRTVMDGAITSEKIAPGAIPPAPLPDLATAVNNYLSSHGITSLSGDDVFTALNSYSVLTGLNRVSYTGNGITWSWTGQHCNVSGTASNTANDDVFNSQSSFPTGVQAGKTYHIYYNSANVRLKIMAYVNGWQMLADVTWDTDITIPSSATGLIVRLTVESGVAVGAETVTPIMVLNPSNNELDKIARFNYDNAFEVGRNGTYFNVQDFITGGLISGVIQMNTKYRVVSKNIMIFDYPIVITPKTGYRFGIHSYVNGNYDADSGWKTSAYTVPANTQFRILIAKQNEDFNTVVTPYDFIEKVTFKTAEQQKMGAYLELYDKGFAHLNVDNLRDDMFEQGSLGTHGEDDSFAATASARTGYLYAEQDIVIRADVSKYPEARSTAHFFDGTGNWLRSTPWQEVVYIPQGSIFRLLCRKIYYTATPFSVSEILECFAFGKQAHFSNIKTCKIVSHQGNTQGDLNHCKLEGYIEAGIKGYDAAETDIRFTSDGIPVCCHDDSFVDRTTSETVTISANTLEQLQTHDFYGSTIATFDSFVKVCKEYNMMCVVDQLGSYTSDHQLATIFEIINKYRMARFTKFVIYDTTIAAKILAKDKNAYLVCGQPYGSADCYTAIYLANQVITDTNKVDVSVNYGIGSDNIETQTVALDPRIGLDIYTLDTVPLKEEFAYLCTSITTNTDPFSYV